MIAWVTVHSAGRLVIADAFFQIGDHLFHSRQREIPRFVEQQRKQSLDYGVFQFQAVQLFPSPLICGQPAGRMPRSLDSDMIQVLAQLEILKRAACFERPQFRLFKCAASPLISLAEGTVPAGRAEFRNSGATDAHELPFCR
mgnify:CR=1 FL=1